MKNKIGVSLFLLYIIQAVFSLKWNYLENLQTIDLYKNWSGFVLLLLILSQWYISIMRMNKEFNAVKKERFLLIHKWVGVVLPLAFFLHSTSIGYGILLLLSLVFLINIALAFINTNSFLDKQPKFFTWWLLIHIFLSVAVLIFSLLHVWLVFIYN